MTICRSEPQTTAIVAVADKQMQRRKWHSLAAHTRIDSSHGKLLTRTGLSLQLVLRFLFPLKPSFHVVVAYGHCRYGHRVLAEDEVTVRLFDSSLQLPQLV